MVLVIRGRSGPGPIFLVTLKDMVLLLEVSAVGSQYDP